MGDINRIYEPHQIMLDMTIHGVVKEMDGCISLEHTCSGVSFVTEATHMVIWLSGEAMSEMTCAWIEIECALIGKKLKQKIKIDNKDIKSSFCFPEGHKTISILKVTEKKYGTACIRKVLLNDHCKGRSMQENARALFIGDSITCGNSVEPFSLFHRFSTKYENGKKAYPYIVSEKQGFNYTIWSYSGMGVWRNHIDFTGDTALKMFSRECLDDRNYEYIFINVGTNDARFIMGEETRSLFLSEYEKLLDYFISSYKTKGLYLVVGPMTMKCNDAIKELAQKKQGELGCVIRVIECRAFLFDGLGNGKHPTYKAQKRMAKIIVSQIGL